MRTSRATVVAAVITASGLLAIGTPEVHAAGCTKQWAYDEAVPGASAKGARAVWRARILHADDWPSGGFAAQVLWAATDNKADMSKWVEVGVTHGWKAADVYTFYTARGSLGSYDERRLSVVAPNPGTSYYFTVRSVSETVYRAEVAGMYFNWSGHETNTPTYQLGLESTCHTSRVDRTNVTEQYYQRLSTGFWSFPADGTLTEYPNINTKISWCQHPIKFRYSQNSQIDEFLC